MSRNFGFRKPEPLAAETSLWVGASIAAIMLLVGLLVYLGWG